MKAYIFYNGDDVSLPDESKQSNWGGYVNPDSAKMFAVCADSWERNGWDVVRLRCPAGTRKWTGRLDQSSYPYNNLIPSIINAQWHRGGMFMVTTDVINNKFFPPAVEPWSTYAKIPFAHFTMAAGWFSSKWFEDAFSILNQYDAGFFPDAPEHTDESVLRHNMSMQKFCNPTSTLKHYSRSMLSRELEKRKVLVV